MFILFSLNLTRIFGSQMNYILHGRSENTPDTSSGTGRVSLDEFVYTANASTGEGAVGGDSLLTTSGRQDGALGGEMQVSGRSSEVLSSDFATSNETDNDVSAINTGSEIESGKGEQSMRIRPDNDRSRVYATTARSKKMKRKSMFHLSVGRAVTLGVSVAVVAAIGLIAVTVRKGRMLRYFTGKESAFQEMEANVKRAESFIENGIVTLKVEADKAQLDGNLELRDHMISEIGKLEPLYNKLVDIQKSLVLMCGPATTGKSVFSFSSRFADPEEKKYLDQGFRAGVQTAKKILKPVETLVATFEGILKDDKSSDILRSAVKDSEGGLKALTTMLM